MIRIFKSSISQILYIETVTEGHVEDFQYNRVGDKFTIDRSNTNVVEVKRADYTLFSDESWLPFANADVFEDYLIDLLKVKNCNYVKPIFNLEPITINQSTSKVLKIKGSFFTPDLTVTINGQVVNSVTFISDNEIDVDFTTGTTDGSYSIEISNGCGSYKIDNVIIVQLSVWQDLRAGGTTFSGTDILAKNGVVINRDANGMFFTGGQNPWASWVKFQSLAWQRGQLKNCQWIFTRPESFMMIGIGSTATNENSTAQYAQAEVEAYFNNSTSLWGLYGNNGTVGGAGNQNVTTNISGGTGVFKIKFTKDGSAGGVFTIYELPSANQSDWDNESNVIASFTIAGTIAPDEVNIMPFIIPRSGGTQRFLAIKVD